MDVTRLKGVVPDSVISQLPAVIEKFGAKTPLRLSHFLAQLAHESGGFTKAVTVENLSYSANRNGNGDEASGDGFKFRGRGYIQLTGKSNYAEFSRFIGEDCVVNPDLVATKYPLASAAFFFNSSKTLWPTCDHGSDDATVMAVSMIVNGGTIGIEDRIDYFHKFFNILI